MKTTSIGELCELKYGKALKKSIRQAGNVPVFGSNGVVGKHNQALIEYDTIIIGRKGSIGEVHLVFGPSWAIDTTYYVDLKDPNSINLDWFFRLLKTLDLSSLNKAAAVPGLNRDDVYKIKISLPPIDDQIRISTLLNKVESLIAKRKKSIANLDEQLKSTFLEIFGDPVRNGKGWEFSTIEDFCKNVIDCPHKTPDYSDSNTKLYCVRSSDIVNGHLELNETRQVDEDFFKDRILRYLPQKDDILYCREGGRLGNAARIITNDRICLGQRIMLFNVSEKHRSHFVWALLESFPFKQKINSLVGGGGAPRINIKDIKKIKAIKPPLNLQNNFAAIVEKVESIKERYRQSFTDLENLYGTLSQKAFKGELDLNRIPLEKEADEEQETVEPQIQEMAKAPQDLTFLMEPQI